MKFLAIPLIFAMSFVALPAFACDGGKQCPIYEKQHALKGAATKAYKAAMHTMHKNMMTGYTGDVDTDFARGMIPHHQGAVDMAEIVLKYGKDEEVRAFAEWIITIQKQEIAEMQHWLTRKGMPANQRVSWYDEAAVAESEAAMHEMHSAMDITYTGDADIDFVRGMIPHHQGAVDMASIVLKHGRQPEMNRLATGITTSQNGEISYMQRWLKAKGCGCSKTCQKQPKPVASKATHKHLH